MELVERRRKPASKEILKLWAEQWVKEDMKVDRQKLLTPRGFQVCLVGGL